MPQKIRNFGDHYQRTSIHMNMNWVFPLYFRHILSPDFGVLEAFPGSQKFWPKNAVVWFATLRALQVNMQAYPKYLVNWLKGLLAMEAGPGAKDLEA